MHKARLGWWHIRRIAVPIGHAPAVVALANGAFDPVRSALNPCFLARKIARTAFAVLNVPEHACG
jgi:hypothetical protein